MRPLVMIPGPIEIDDAVVAALGRSPKSHLDPEFIETFGRELERLATERALAKLGHAPRGVGAAVAAAKAALAAEGG